jgi:hypothetical protein
MVSTIARVYNAAFGLERISRSPFASKVQMTTSKCSGVNRVGFILMAAFAFVCSCGRGPGGGLPSSLSRFPSDLGNPGLDLTGIDEDGWIGEAGSVTLQQPAGQQMFTIRGMVPRIDQLDFQTQVELRVDNQSVATKTVGVGDFRISAPAPGVALKRHVVVQFSATQQLPGRDGRLVGARLQFLGFEPAKSGALNATSDIVRGSGIELGAKWGPLETFRNETFRWVENDAQIRIVTAKSGDVALSMVVASGPGIGSRTFVVKVLDESGRQVNAAQVENRGRVKFFLPVEAGKPNNFRLHVDEGGKPAHNDPRILNFRVFQISVNPVQSQQKMIHIDEWG